jgi:hypothetical protein
MLCSEVLLCSLIRYNKLVLSSKRIGGGALGRGESKGVREVTFGTGS